MLLELIILSFIVYFIVRLLKKSTPVSTPDIETSVKEGVKSAIKELEEEKSQEEEFLKKLDKPAMGVFSTTNREEEPINTKDLIPVNLSEGEKELLRMFYNQ
jgi:5'-deoxynucleotidase YfbR-like HD superfamily hydrolase